VDGVETRSCVTPLSKVAGKSITTLEGLPAWYAKQKNLASAPELHPLQEAVIDEQALQCGYCYNGQIVKGAELLSKNAQPTVEQIRTAMNGHLCRCGTYPRMIKAIQRAALIAGADNERRLSSTAFPRRLPRGRRAAGRAHVRAVGPAQQPPGGAFAGPFSPNPELLDTWLAIHWTTRPRSASDTSSSARAIPRRCSSSRPRARPDMSQVSRLSRPASRRTRATNASASIARGGPRVRLAAADARQVLLARASAQLGVPVDRLTVTRGVVSVAGNPGQSVTYGALIGDRPFDVPYTGKAPLKDYRAHTVVGASVPRNDLPDKARGKYVYISRARPA
jgi:aerobic-type carbon monoxide dehydrogenase small subunit (CoxS/CutS family)